MTHHIHVSVILPTFNERDNILPLITSLLTHLSAAPVEIIVVDDNSPDGTGDLVADFAAGHDHVRLLKRIDERGLTSAIAAGIRAARGPVVMWMDCDLSMPPAVAPALVAAIDQGADLAVGSRYVTGGRDAGHSLMAQAFSRAINLFAMLLLGRQVHDYTSGFIAARRSVFDRIALRGDYGEYCIDLLARSQRRGFSIREVPYTCTPRHAGESKTALNAWGYLRRGSKYVDTILRLWWSRLSGAGRKDLGYAGRSSTELE
jgi:dolichol-phosphate mannosyltransferase